jgi:hypothetical protein
MRNKITAVIIFIFSLASLFAPAKAQSSSRIELEKFLDKAEAGARRYREFFKNLSAEEIKTVETFRRSGRVLETRRIKSLFIVYQSEKTGLVSEFRNILEFNGQKVGKKDEETVGFFERLAKTDSSREEFQKIREEGIRYDGTISVWGFTLGQGFALDKQVRRFFEFEIAGTEILEGRKVLVVAYRQKEYTPFVLINPTDKERKNAPDGIEVKLPISPLLRPTNPRMNGKFWLDAQTAKIWKSETEFTIQPPGEKKPIIVSRGFYEYQSSKFEILVPKKIVVANYAVSKSDGLSPIARERLSVFKQWQTTFEYTNFSKAGTEIKTYDFDKIDSGAKSP